MRINHLDGVFSGPKSIKAHGVGVFGVDKREVNGRLAFIFLCLPKLKGNIRLFFGEANKVLFIQTQISQADGILVDCGNLQLLRLEEAGEEINFLQITKFYLERYAMMIIIAIIIIVIVMIIGTMTKTMAMITTTTIITITIMMIIIIVHIITYSCHCNKPRMTECMNNSDNNNNNN